MLLENAGNRIVFSWLWELNDGDAVDKRKAQQGHNENERQLPSCAKIWAVLISLVLTMKNHYRRLWYLMSLTSKVCMKVNTLVDQFGIAWLDQNVQSILSLTYSKLILGIM